MSDDRTSTDSRRDRASTRPRGSATSIRSSSGRPSSTRFVKLDPRDDGTQPGHVRGRDRQRRSRPSTSSLGLVAGGSGRRLLRRQVALWLWFTVLFANFAEAMAEGRGKAQADALRKTKTETIANRRRVDGAIEQVAGRRAAQGRHRRRVGRRDHPGRRRRHRGHRLGRRVGDHRRVGPGHPRERRRPQRRHRRHAGALRPDRRAHHLRPGRDVPRPHDRAGRGRERQKTPNEIALDILLVGLTHHLPARGRDAGAVRHLLRRRRVGDACSSRCSSA